MSKIVSILLMGITAITLSGCGGDSSSSDDSISDKNYIVILKGVPSGVCETDTYKDILKGYGIEGVVTEETETTTNCATYGKSNDGDTCAETEYGDGDYNCVVGFDDFSGSGDISFRKTDSEPQKRLNSVKSDFAELLEEAK